MSREILFPLFQYILADDGNRTGKYVPDGTNKGGGGGAIKCESSTAFKGNIHASVRGCCSPG